MDRVIKFDPRNFAHVASVQRKEIQQLKRKSHIFALTFDWIEVHFTAIIVFISSRIQFFSFSALLLNVFNQYVGDS